MNVWNILEQNKEFDDLYIQRLCVEGLLGTPPYEIQSDVPICLSLLSGQDGDRPHGQRHLNQHLHDYVD